MRPSHGGCWSRVSSLSLGVGPGRKEPAACSGWWAGDCRAGVGCRCLSEGPACGSGYCAVLVAAHTALSSPSSSALLALQGLITPLLEAEKCSVFVVVTVFVSVCSHSLVFVSQCWGKRKTETLLGISSAVSLSGLKFSWGSVRVTPVPLGGGPQWACLWASWSVLKGRVGGRLWKGKGCVHWGGWCVLRSQHSCGREQCIEWMGLCGNGVNSKWKMEEQNRACLLSLRS